MREGAGLPRPCTVENAESDPAPYVQPGHKNVAKDFHMIMDEGAAAWLQRTAAKNLWRVPDYYELDDLVSDGMECWVKVTQRYSNVKSAAHLMALFKTTFTNHVHDLARKKMRMPDSINECQLEAGVALSIEAIENEHTILPEPSLAMAMAPDAVRCFMAAFDYMPPPPKRKAPARPGRTLNVMGLGITSSILEQYSRIAATYLKESAQ